MRKVVVLVLASVSLLGPGTARATTYYVGGTDPGGGTWYAATWANLQAAMTAAACRSRRGGV